MGRGKVAIPREVQDQMCRDYRQGESIRNIASIYGIGRNRAYEIVHSGCDNVKLGRPKVSRDSMIEDYINGLSLTKLAKKYGYARSTVYRIIKRKGVQMREARDIARKSDIIKELQSGEISQSEIARKYNVSRQYVSLIKKELEANKNENLAL